MQLSEQNGGNLSMGQLSDFVDQYFGAAGRQALSAHAGGAMIRPDAPDALSQIGACCRGWISAPLIVRQETA